MFYLDFCYFYVQDVNQELLPWRCNLQLSVAPQSSQSRVQCFAIKTLRPNLVLPAGPQRFDSQVEKLAQSSPTRIIIYI